MNTVLASAKEKRADEVIYVTWLSSLRRANDRLGKRIGENIKPGTLFYCLVNWER